MSQCAWVALLEDRETGSRSVKHFRYDSFVSPDTAKQALETVLGGLFIVHEVSTNPYKFKELH
jgi:hypothetical protein